MKRTLVLFSLLCIKTLVLAQVIERKPENFVHLSWAGQYYFNKVNVENDNSLPNPISTKNTFGQNLELAYQHTTRWGLIIFYGIQYGAQRHAVNIDYDMSKFDPDANSLKGYNLHYTYDMRFRFINQRLMLGYARPLPQSLFKGWLAEFKAGAGTKAFSRGYGFGQPVEILYPANEPGKAYYNQFSLWWVKMGNVNNHGNDWSIRSKENSFLQTFEFYLGVRKNMHIRRLRNISAGIELTRAAYRQSGDYIMVISYDKKFRTISTDVYNNRNISIGLRLGVGLW